MKSKEYSAYVKGLIEGSNLDLTTPEGKVLSALSELTAQMAGELEALEGKLETCNAYIEEIDEDLGAVEEIVYDLDDEDGCSCGCDDCDDEDDDCDCCDCDDCDDCDGCDCDEDEDDDEEFYCALCPHCNGKIFFDDSVNPEDIICPNCQKPLVDDEDLEDLDGNDDDKE